MPGFIDLSGLRGAREPSGRWTPFGAPEALDAMPAVHRDRVLFLDAPSTRAAYDALARRDVLCAGDGFGNDPFGGGCFRSVERIRAGGEGETRKWLHRRGVPYADPALLLPLFGAADDPAVLTTWKMVVKYAAVLFSRDDLVVVGEKADWCLHYHHDEVLTFARDPDYARVRW
jgi:hypothetical protein